MALHSGLDKDLYELHLHQFRTGEARLIFTTDVAIGCVDISDHVITDCGTVVVNYDAAEGRELHARRIVCAERGSDAGAQRLAISLIICEDYALRPIVETMRRCGQEVSDDLMTIAKLNSWDSKKW